MSTHGTNEGEIIPYAFRLKYGYNVDRIPPEWRFANDPEWAESEEGQRWIEQHKAADRRRRADESRLLRKLR